MTGTFAQSIAELEALYGEPIPTAVTRDPCELPSADPPALTHRR